MSRYPHVVAPISIGAVELRNRVYIPPHGIPNFAAPAPNASTVPSVEYAEYFRQRAEGGVGLIVHSMSVMRAGAFIPINSPVDERSIPSFQAVAEGVHGAGGKIFGELWYFWAQYPWEPNTPGQPMWGPSPVQPTDTFHVTRAMSVREIARLRELFVRGARNLRAAGYDGITLHVSHGALLEQFLSPYFNRRTDEYGGDVSGRMRLLVEILEEVREAMGGLPVGIRLTSNERLPGGLDVAQSTEILNRLKRDGLIDFVDLDFCVEPQQDYLLLTTYFVEPLKHQRDDIHLLREAGALDDIVVMAAGRRITQVAQMEQMLAAGVVDVIGSVRGFMAEPEMLKNALAGREDRNRACLACNNQWGWGGGFTCVINPAVGREARWGAGSFQPAAQAVKVVVVGGGPAGLEAARVAARRGHEVVLIEQRPYLGGLMKAKANLPGRSVYQEQIDWWERTLIELGVDVRTESEATTESVLAEEPDAVILATGSSYDATGSCGWNVNPIPGADRAHVCTADDVLLHGQRPGGTVLIFDSEGISSGPGVAELLAGAGARCLIVSPTAPGSALAEAPDALARLGRLDVEILPQTYLSEIGEGEVTLAPVLRDSENLLAGRMVGEGYRRTGIDAVVLAAMRTPTNTVLEAELEGRVDTLYVIGDGLAPRDLRAATYEGQYFARLLGEKDAPKTTGDAQFAPVADEAFAYLGPAASLLEHPIERRADPDPKPTTAVR